MSFYLTETIQTSEGAIVALDISNDHRYLGIVSKEGTIQVFDMVAHFRKSWIHRRTSQFSIIKWDRTVQGEVLVINSNEMKACSYALISEDDGGVGEDDEAVQSNSGEAPAPPMEDERTRTAKGLDEFSYADDEMKVEVEMMIDFESERVTDSG
ncbi:hypothetical protein F5878DRAFT_647786 [Lentinula raphanica]|uniref:WD40 repeat-like protein n=1 Tax=Lentinula raphanica TaxID=153919 RepID=A0AA38U447_9AGAR|nr:hypothetical protein F5878DRAFT_647786 [Lentinula raphanica]